MATDSKDNLTGLLRIWKHSPLGEADGGSQGAHLNDAQLYRMAEKNGMLHTEASAAEHMSQCPLCLEKFAEWRGAITLVEESRQEEEHLLAIGEVEAVACSSSLASTSRCSRFVLTVLPDQANRELGTITLACQGAAPCGFDGRAVVCRDARLAVIVEGVFVDGRIERSGQAIAHLDLSAWYVIEIDHPASS